MPEQRLYAIKRPARAGGYVVKGANKKNADTPAPRPDLEEYRALLADPLCSGLRMDEKQLRGLLNYIDRCEAAILGDAKIPICRSWAFTELVGEIRRGKS